MSSWTFSFWKLIKHLDFRRTCVLPWRLVNLHFKPCVEVIQWIWKGGIRLYFKVGDGLTTLPHVACVSSVQDWGCPEGFLVTWCEAASQVFSSTSAEMSDDKAVIYVLAWTLCTTAWVSMFLKVIWLQSIDQIETWYHGVTNDKNFFHKDPKSN